MHNFGTFVLEMDVTNDVSTLQNQQILANSVSDHG
jgi:hypothetical protein